MGQRRHRNHPPMNPTHPLPPHSRRDFIRTGSAAAAAMTLALPQALRGAPAMNITTDRIKIGLIGCGGRGSGAAAQALTADSNTELWAMGDVFARRTSTSRHKALDAQIQGRAGRVNVADGPQVRRPRRLPDGACERCGSGRHRHARRVPSAAPQGRRLKPANTSFAKSRWASIRRASAR